MWSWRNHEPSQRARRDQKVLDRSTPADEPFPDRCKSGLVAMLCVGFRVFASLGTPPPATQTGDLATMAAKLMSLSAQSTGSRTGKAFSPRLLSPFEILSVLGRAFSSFSRSRGRCQERGR